MCYRYPILLLSTIFMLEWNCSDSVIYFVMLPSQESERSCICVLPVMYLCVSGHVFVCYLSCICVLEVLILPLSTIFQLDFGTVFGQCVIFGF